MATIFQFARDSLTNLVSRMGTERDKASSSYYPLPVIGDDQVLNAYRGAWLPRKIVDIPAFDSVRAWRDWQAEGVEIEPIEAEETRLNVRGKVLEGRIKARLFGGAAIHIGTGDANLAEPLDVDRIGKGGIKYLTVLSRRQLSIGEIERDPASEWYGKPRIYRLSAGDKAQVDIHPSRLVILTGNAQPDFELVGGGELAWGDSVLLAVMDAIKQADGTAANIASLIFEAKVDIIRIPNFMASLANEGYKAKILERYTLANTSKGINGTLMLDKEEEYESKSANFSTLPDILDRFLQIVSGAADIPATRLLGQSPAGMNATGESDLRNYYDRLSAMQALEMTPAMFRLDEALIRSALGSRPKDIYYEWAPLWGMSDKEKADVFKTKADAARAIAGGTGQQPLIPIDALSDALVNALVEDGSLPGLEAAIDEYGKLSEQEPSEEELAAAAANANEPAAPQRKAANDAEPRTLYVRRDVVNASEIKAWAEGQGIPDLVDDLHVTIIYSRTPMDWIKAGNASEWGNEKGGNITIAPGGPRVVEPLGNMTAVLMFASSQLCWRHEEIVRAGASHDFEDYQPHISLTKADVDLDAIEPYRGKIVLGPEVFEEVKQD
ncbi:phage portal protein [Mesorhizobium sp. M0701]|uniref:anti-CBASS protein Acb1 family protein n=1 Tax=Mesorhizobium sp. M0701 TaxID=2956989 RepID=UPI003335B55A